MATLTLALLLIGLAEVKSQFLSQLTNSAAAFITKESSNTNEVGEYSYQVETSDGQSRGEHRTVLNPGTDHEISLVEGYYSYIGADGQRYTVGYKSDENGFQPEGEHLPPAADVKRRRPQVGVPPDVNLSQDGSSSFAAGPPPAGISQDALKSLQGQQIG